MTEYLNNYIDKLQNKRKKLKLSYDDLVKRSGLPKATITNTLLKYFKNTPSTDVLNKLALALDEPCIDDIAQGVSTYKLTPDKEELLMLYEEIGNKLGTEAQKGYINYAKFLLDNK